VKPMQFSAVLGNPPERELSVIELFVDRIGQWGEIQQESGVLLLEVYPAAGCDAWTFTCDDLNRLFEKAKERLVSPLEKEEGTIDINPMYRQTDDSLSVHSDGRECARFSWQGGNLVLTFVPRSDGLAWRFLLKDVITLVEQVASESRRAK
jgi:hypothetical protein